MFVCTYMKNKKAYNVCMSSSKIVAKSLQHVATFKMCH